MKQTAFFLLLAFASLGATCQSPTATPHAQAAGYRVEVIDFHTSHRCRSCMAIEKLTLETLSTYFAPEMKSGKVVFRLLNVDEKANAKIAEQFGAFGTSLYVYLVKGNQSKVIDLTDFSFRAAFDRDKFHQGLKAEIEKMLLTL